MLTEDYADKMFRAYVECALWAETHGETDESFEQAGFTLDDLSAESTARMRADVEAFADVCADDLGNYWTAEQAGHDFWLTRNRHGAGFWDRYAVGDGERVGRLLTDAAHAYGESWVYVSDAGEVEVS
jgi:hypothetical protein